MAVVTISRETGAWGNEMGEGVAVKLGYDLITKETIRQIGISCSLDFQKACEMFENEESEGFWDRFFFIRPEYTSLFKSLIFDLAARGKAVILGRGANVVLGGLPGVFRVRVVAPLPVRVKRVMALQNLSEHEADKLIRQQDRNRRSLVESVFQVDLNDNHLYDLVLNTDEIGLEAGAEIICHAFKEKMKRQELGGLAERFQALALAKRVEVDIVKEVRPSFLQDIEAVPEGEGVIGLQGFVRDNAARAQAEKIALATAGVKKVNNRLSLAERLDL